MILNEVMFFNNPGIKQMEKLFSNIQKELKKDGSKDMNKSKNIIEMGKIIEKTFGFEKVYLKVSGNDIDMDAYTYNFYYNKKVNLLSNEELSMIKSKDGIKYKHPKNKKLLICLNLYNLNNLAPRENIAVLLHEIGHNFYLELIDNQFFRKTQICAKFLKLAKGMIVTQCFDSKLILSITKLGKDIVSFLKDSSKEDVDPRSFEGLLIKIEKDIESSYNRFLAISEKIKRRRDEEENSSSVKKAVKKFFDVIRLGFINTVLFGEVILFYPLILLAMKSKKTLVNDYDNEKFADNFAISYGFGAELAKSFNDLYKNDKYFNAYAKGRISRFTLEFNVLLFSFLTISECHPSSIYRITNARKKFEYELKTNKTLSKEEIKKIQKDIDIIKEIEEVNPSIMVQFQQKFNRIFHLDKVKDKNLGSSSDEEIYDINTSNIKDKIKNK